MSNPQLTDTIAHELDVLTQLHQNTGVKQRDLAQTDLEFLVEWSAKKCRPGIRQTGRCRLTRRGCQSRRVCYCR